MTDVRNPFVAPTVAALTALDWGRANDAMIAVGERIIELFARWSGERSVGDEITALGWSYVFHRDLADELGEQLRANGHRLG
jgi:hypothetical protein